VPKILGRGKGEANPAAGPRPLLSFISIFPWPAHISPFEPTAPAISTSSSQKGQQHKCRKFEWTSAVNEICKYFSKIELFWQIFFSNDDGEQKVVGWQEVWLWV